VKSSELVRIIKKDGWYILRQEGSHMIMQHDTKPGQLVVPVHGSKEVGKGLAMKLLKDAGIR
jgi:mRNA interferase HicA